MNLIYLAICSWIRKKLGIFLKRHSGESRARREALALSSNYSMFGISDQVRHDEFGLFTISSNLSIYLLKQLKGYGYRIRLGI